MAIPDKSEATTADVDLSVWELQLPAPGSVDLRAAEMSWSRQLHDLLGVPASQLKPSIGALLTAVHPQDRARVAAALRAAVETGVAFHIRHRLVRTDGSERLVHHQSEIERAGKSRGVWRIHGTLVDITARRERELGG